MNGFHKSPWLLATVVSVLLIAGTAALTAQQVAFGLSSFDPLVARSTRTQPLRFEVEISGSPANAMLELDGPGARKLTLTDDGTGADRVAGDGVYSTSVPAKDVVSVTAGDVFRKFVGYLSVPVPGGPSGYGVFAAVRTPAMPPVRIRSLASDAQYADSVINIVDRGLFRPGATSNDVERVTSRFYDFFTDQYDFFIIVMAPGAYENRSHVPVKSAAKGIGEDALPDRSRRYGSSGRLLGYSYYPNLTGFDGAHPTMLHELGHQWVNSLNFVPFKNSVPHWPYSNLAAGLMGYSTLWGQGLSFPCELVEKAGGVRLKPASGSPTYSDWDLYLMGVLPASSTGDAIVLDEPAFSTYRKTNWCSGQLYTGPVTHFTVQDLIAAEGKRVPDAKNARKHFRMAVILMTRDGLADSDTMAYVDAIARRASERRELAYRDFHEQGTVRPFFLATRKLATLDTLIYPQKLPRPILPPPPIVRIMPDGYVVRYTTLREAIASVSPGATVRVPRSFELDEPLPIPIETPGVRIEAEPGSVLDGHGAEAAFAVEADNVYLSGLQIRDVGTGVWVRSGSITLQDNRFEASGVAVRIDGGHIELTGCNRFEDGELGLFFGPDADIEHTVVAGASFATELAVVNEGSESLWVASSSFAGRPPEEMVRGSVEIADSRDEDCAPALPEVYQFEERFPD